MRPRSAALVLAVVASLVALAPAAHARPPRTAADGERIAELVQQVTRATPWELVGATRLAADGHHPEGLVRCGDRWFLSTVEVTEPTRKLSGTPKPGRTDRTAGAGVGHLMSFDLQGRLLRDQVIRGSLASEYHPGGLDYDGRDLWVTMAQYRPDSTATALRIDPETGRTTRVLRAADHLGGVVHDTARDRLVALTWGSRAGLTWRLPAPRGATAVTPPLADRVNPSAFVDYQDCKYLGRVRGQADPLMLCGGITGFGDFQLGGIALVSTRTLLPVYEVPLTELTPAGNVVTRNPIDARVVGGRLRLYLAPDDDATTIYAYEARLDG